MSTEKKESASPQQTPELMDKLKQFVRTRGMDYLNDTNISSVGIGYKCVGGKRTKELAIQFTVDVKAVPELLPTLQTSPIPDTITIDGVDIPTDVIQRSFEPSYTVVQAALTDTRKLKQDPIRPGISVANRRVSAGTIGAIVYGRTDGKPYVLSNWHVLHGPNGVVGDAVVQPGPFDDNRMEQNALGTLIRSHLGAAGDCAIASIDARMFNRSILDLDVIPEKIGEPELGDKVIKSGRTTGVTHGMVTRVNTVVKLDYGGAVGEQAIGGFEIGVDDDHLPGNGEISMGGDSGSLWMFKQANGTVTNIVAGLHFAGESSASPDEYALACYPKSVFEKLDITLTPPETDDTTQSGLGYKPGFLGIPVAVPKLSTNLLKDAFQLNDTEILAYTHFSLAMSKSRRFAIWVAWNIDGGAIKKINRKGIKFVFDKRVPEKYQAGDSLYAGNDLDRGHIARRADLIWGTDAEAQQANIDSFYFTNITPQMNNFNQTAMGGIWGKLEDAVFDQVDVDNLKVSVIGGPVFKADDRVYKKIKIPREFYKIICYVDSGKLKSKAFLLTQNLDELESLDLNSFKVYEVQLSEIEARCDFTLPNALKQADTATPKFGVRDGSGQREPIRSLSDIHW